MDREKVIKGLEQFKADLKPFCGNRADWDRFDAGFALLKEQEPLEPYACEGDMRCGNGCEIVGYIRESDGKIERLANYCPYCGRPVKWD